MLSCVVDQQEMSGRLTINECVMRGEYKIVYHIKSNGRISYRR